MICLCCPPNPSILPPDEGQYMFSNQIILKKERKKERKEERKNERIGDDRG